MALATEKRKLTTEVTRYITLVSALSNPPVEYLDGLSHFRNLIRSATAAELAEMQTHWDTLQPNDPDSLLYVKKGVVHHLT
jgi:hypothetical protein